MSAVQGGRQRWRLIVFAGLLALAANSCGSKPEVILRTAAGAEITAEEIDREPLWLLPAGGVGWFHLDTASAARSELGRQLLTDLEARLALPASAGLSLERDVRQLSVASYSMKGLDFAGVAQGRFDVERITAAASHHEGGPLTPPLTRSQYAGRSLFTAGPVGFVLVTPQTVLFGNDVAIRRCLDRIAEARVADDLPSWAKELLAASNAAFSLGLDLGGSAVTAALPRRLAQLRGASLARAVGNFDPPGINLAGSITHADHDAARVTATELLQAGGSLNMYGRLFGLGQPLQKMETRAVGNDTQLVLAVDGNAVQVLMKRFLPPPPPAAPSGGPGWATSSEGARRATALP